MLNLISNFELDIPYAGPKSELSVKETTLLEYDYECKMKYVSVPGGGFGNAAASFAKDFREEKIKLNAKVTEINYQLVDQEDEVLITYMDNNNDEGGILKQIVAKSVLVTVSLGVLKAGNIQFVPNLPPEKQDAIDNMGYGHLNKCILYWENVDDIVWPKEKNWFLLVTPDEESSGRWTTFFNPTEYKNVTMLVGLIAGTDALAMEDQSNDEVLTDVMQNLRAMFPSIKRPTKVLITRFGKDETLRGAYSFEKVGRNFQRDAAELKRTIKEHIWFAGEATNLESWHGTTIGSWNTGDVAARDIIRNLNVNN